MSDPTALTPAERGLAQRILDRMGHVERELKNQGLVNHANGARLCIVAVMKLTAESEPMKPEPTP